jgi:hypothetical protein
VASSKINFCYAALQWGFDVAKAAYLFPFYTSRHEMKRQDFYAYVVCCMVGVMDRGRWRLWLVAALVVTISIVLIV